MVLYHAYHAGTLAQVFVHRLTEKRNEKAVLLVGKKTLLGNIFDKLEEFKENGLIDNIIYCVADFGAGGKTIDECEKQIYEYFEEVFKSSGYSIDDFDEIYSSVDTIHSFGVYLAMKKRPYIFFETIPDFFSVAQKRVDMLNCPYSDTMTKYGASNATGEYATRMVYPRSKFDKSENDKIIYFDFEKKLADIQEEDKAKLLEIYGAPKNIDTDKEVDIIIGCSQWLLRDDPNLKRETGIMYQVLGDYLMPDAENIVIKPHPLTRFTAEDFRENFDCPVFPEYFPSNYLPLIKGLKVRKTYSTTSSGGKLAEGIPAQLQDWKFVSAKQYHLIVRAHYILSLYYYLSEKGICSQLLNLGISNDFLQNFISHSFMKDDETFKWLDSARIEDKSFAIIDNLLWNSVDEKKCLFNFINSEYGDYVFAFMDSSDISLFGEIKGTLADNIVTIKLMRKKNKSKVLDKLTADYIYVYCPNELAKKEIVNFTYNKKNRFLGVDIEAKVLTESEKTNFLLMNK